MDFSSPHCIVEIDGHRFDSWNGKSVMSASVNLTTDRSGEGVVDLYDPNFKIIDGLFANGVKSANALFYFGWGKDVGKPFFLGNLARVEWNDNITTFRFHDNSIKMKQERKTLYHKKKTDLQILKDLAIRNGLKFDSKNRLPESQPFESLMQAGKTDWEFALKVAAESGLLLYVRENTLYAVEAGTTKNELSSATLNFEKDFTLLRGFGLSYKLPKNPKGRIKKATVRVRGKNDKALVTTVGDEEGGVSDLIINKDLPSVSVARAAQTAKARIGKRKEYAFEHSLKTLPSFQKRINLRDVITLAGMGKFFSGDYFVTEVTYQFEPGHLICEMNVGNELKSLKPKPKTK